MLTGDIADSPFQGHACYLLVLIMTCAVEGAHAKQWLEILMCPDRHGLTVAETCRQY